VSHTDLEVALTELKRVVVRATLRRKGLEILDEALEGILLDTSYTTLESCRINPEHLKIRHLSGRVGQAFYRVTHFRCIRLLFRESKSRCVY